MTWLDKSERRAAFKLVQYAKQRGKCAYCEDPITLGGATIDHMVPKSRGGKDSASNLRLVCAPCNNLKANWLPEDGPLTGHPVNTKRLA